MDLKEMSKKIYILVHAWLNPRNQGIQAAHTIQGWAKASAGLSIILLETSKGSPQADLVETLAVANKHLDGSDISPFWEEKSCNGGQLTAIAMIINPEDCSSPVLSYLSKYRLAY